MNMADFTVKEEENKALKWAGLGLLIALALAAVLYFGPLATYVDDKGATVKPFMDNIILIITFVFFVPGLLYGMKLKKFN